MSNFGFKMIFSSNKIFKAFSVPAKLTINIFNGDLRTLRYCLCFALLALLNASKVLLEDALHVVEQLIKGFVAASFVLFIFDWRHHASLLCTPSFARKMAIAIFLLANLCNWIH